MHEDLDKYWDVYSKLFITSDHLKVGLGSKGYISIILMLHTVYRKVNRIVDMSSALFRYYHTGSGYNIVLYVFYFTPPRVCGVPSTLDINV